MNLNKINKILLFLTILILIFVISNLSYNYYHPFWSKQPISKYTNFLTLNNGIISQEKPPEPIISTKYYVDFLKDKNQLELDLLIKFLNQNYIDVPNMSYQFDLSYLNFNLNPNNPDRINLILKEGINIIGFISSKYLEILINKKIYFCQYVDNLCVDKQYRKQNLAAILISHMAYYGFQKGYNMFIFKKDSYPLPFRYIASYQNKIYQIPNYNFDDQTVYKGSLDKIELIYSVFNQYLEQFNSKCQYSILDFKHYFFNDYTYIYYQLDDQDKISNMIILYDNKLKLNDQNIIEICYCIINDQQNFKTLFQTVLSMCFKNNFSYCNINSFDSSLGEYEKDLDIIKNYKTYIHTYNYHHNQLLTNCHLYIF